MTALTLTVDELVVQGWSRRSTDRFTAALERALPDAVAEARRGDRPPAAPDAASGATLTVALDRRQRRDPDAAAAAVAAAIAAAVVQHHTRVVAS